MEPDATRSSLPGRPCQCLFARRNRDRRARYRCPRSVSLCRRPRFRKPGMPLVTGENHTIGEDAFIGARVFVMPGVTIGARGVVGACSACHQRSASRFGCRRKSLQIIRIRNGCIVSIEKNISGSNSPSEQGQRLLKTPHCWAWFQGAIREHQESSTTMIPPARIKFSAWWKQMGRTNGAPC